MIRDSGQTGQTGSQGFFASCWESICAFFRKISCYICCPISRVAHSDENQAPVVPISQRSVTSDEENVVPSSLISTHMSDNRSLDLSTTLPSHREPEVPLPSLTGTDVPWVSYTESEESYESMPSGTAIPYIPQRHVEARHVPPEVRAQALEGLIEPDAVSKDQVRPQRGAVRHFRIWQDDLHKPDYVWFEEAYLDEAILRSENDLSVCRQHNNGNLFESINDPQGNAGIACRIAQDNHANFKRQAIIIAGNHGKVGGGLVDPFYRLQPDNVYYSQRGQEESGFANFLATKFGTDRDAMTQYYNENLVNQWGMGYQPVPPERDTPVTRRAALQKTAGHYGTTQQVNYYHAANSSLYGDAWHLNAEVSAFYFTGRGRSQRIGGLGSGQLIRDRNYSTNRTPVDFMFCAAPNAAGPNNNDTDKTGSMAKTTCQNAYVTEDDLSSPNSDEIIRQKFEFFKDGIRWALRAALDLAIDSGVKIIQVPWLGGNIYAGEHFTRLGLWNLNVFHELLNEVLDERIPIDVLRESGETEIIEGVRRAQYFERVILGGLGPSNYSSQ